jgi:hypothetical protein
MYLLCVNPLLGLICSISPRILLALLVFNTTPDLHRYPFLKYYTALHIYILYADSNPNPHPSRTWSFVVHPLFSFTHTLAFLV